MVLKGCSILLTATGCLDPRTTRCTGSRQKLPFFNLVHQHPHGLQKIEGLKACNDRRSLELLEMNSKGSLPRMVQTWPGRMRPWIWSFSDRGEHGGQEELSSGCSGNRDWESLRYGLQRVMAMAGDVVSNLQPRRRLLSRVFFFASRRASRGE